MEIISSTLGIALGALLMAVVQSSPGANLFEVDVHNLAILWEKEHGSPSDPFSLRHGELKDRLHAMAREFPELIRLEPAGNSVEGREIYLVKIGTGSDKILLWSQMHGDEPTATSALLDIFQFFGRHHKEPWAAEVLRKYTLLCIPMLNPDGAERNQRRNAQNLDINRDARMLQSPEGKLLKEIRDRYAPILGFNLHNQNSTTTVGDTGKVATIALLAVGTDLPAPANQNEGKKPLVQSTPSPHHVPVSKQAAVVVYDALRPFVPGHISRYDESYNPRAFGDNLALWGTPVVLIESGGVPAGQPANVGVKLNFIGLLATLNSLASGRIETADPAVYDALLVNSDNPIYDLILQNAWICNGTGIPVFRGDVAVGHESRGGRRKEAIIADIGDLRVNSTHKTIDCTGLLLTPGLIAWDPTDSPLSVNHTHVQYLRQGIVTVLESLRWGEMEQAGSPEEKIQNGARATNWGFVISGLPEGNSKTGVTLFAAWLASGGRCWIRESEGNGESVEQLSRIVQYFGVETISTQNAERYEAPVTLEGDPAKVLPRWTSEAARRFRLPGLGIITIGGAADLVLWRSDRPGDPLDLSDFRPSQVIMNGRVIDLNQQNIPNLGRFLGR